MKKFLLTCAIAILFTSCNKEDDTQPNIDPEITETELSAQEVIAGAESKNWKIHHTARNGQDSYLLPQHVFDDRLTFNHNGLLSIDKGNIKKSKVENQTENYNWAFFDYLLNGGFDTHYPFLDYLVLSKDEPILQGSMKIYKASNNQLTLEIDSISIPYFNTDSLGIPNGSILVLQAEE